ncbi:MAG: hypothetical protein FD156_2117 [Nitrospirae bacterium]|nr:MAG: hypothetical protein FD156_2117 [Nitrospirota bacterium]
MKSLVRYKIVGLITICLAPVFVLAYAFAWENPCQNKAVHFQSIPHDKESTIILEAERVVSVNGDTFTYSLGKEIITITADSFASLRFIKDVKDKRCSAHETVILVPERKSPFNKNFKAKRPQ